MQANLPPPPGTRIPAWSRRQAMDWSLVLASQGIEHVLDQSAEHGWGLIVAASDAEAARGAIQLYRRENQRWPWRKTIAPTGEVFDWAAVGWGLLTCAFFWLSQRNPGLREAGVLSATAVQAGEWWRFFTATLLHADLTHLATNAGFGFLLLGLAMGRHGTGLGLLAAFLAGVCGNILSWFLHGQGFVGLGASGVVMGGLGLAAVQSLPHLRHHPHAVRLMLGGLAAGVMLFVLLGLSPGTDVVAHFGGFAGGVGFGFVLSAGNFARRPLINLAAGVAFAALVVWTWMQALRPPG